MLPGPIIPVVDVRQGTAVHAVRGQRHRYQPLANQFAVPASLATLLLGLAEQFATVYVADLDGLMDGKPNRQLGRRLAQLPCATLVDGGWSSPEALANYLRDTGAGANDRLCPIVALESIPSPSRLREFRQSFPERKLFFSLDLREGLVRQPPTAGSSTCLSPLEWALQAREAGIDHLIVLDLASVGASAGIPTLELIRRIRLATKDLHIYTGGGVRSAADVEAAIRSGCKGVLVGTALYSGHLLAPLPWE